MGGRHSGRTPVKCNIPGCEQPWMVVARQLVDPTKRRLTYGNIRVIAHYCQKHWDAMTSNSWLVKAQTGV